MLTEQQIAEKATIETVTRVQWWNDKLLTFTTTRPGAYTFVPGQYARLGVPDKNGPIWRAYSMTSAPHQDFLEFYGVIVSGGLFTRRLKTLKAGDSLFVDRQSYGFMTPDRFKDGDDLWMFATGTGIGPFISMLRDPYVWQTFRNLILVHCVRYLDEFSYRDELTKLVQQPPPNAHARLFFIRSMTRDKTMPNEPLLLNGRITTLLNDGTLEKAINLSITDTASRIMLCGNPDMIEDMRRILHQRGLRPCRRTLPGQFVTENYW